MIKILPLPCDLPAVAAIVGTDPDGEIERRVYALVAAGDLVGACALALTIENPYRRAVWARQFRQATIDAAQRCDTSCHTDHAARNSTRSFSRSAANSEVHGALIRHQDAVEAESSTEFNVELDRK